MANQPVSYSLVIPYVCLACSGITGERCANGSENWTWRLIPLGTINGTINGRVGPFCCKTCAEAFSMPCMNDVHATEPLFTLREWDHLHFHRARAQARALAGA